MSWMKSRYEADYIAEYSKYLDLKKVGSSYAARCPFHEDRHPSFFVSPNGLFHCFGCGIGGNFEKFKESMEHQNMSKNVNDLTDYSPNAKITVYKYLDLWGKELYEKHRIEENGSKTFRIVKKASDFRSSLYHLELLPKKDNNTEIWLAEGEKCADTILPIALENNAIAIGFNSFKAEYEGYLEPYFKDTNIVIFEDADPKGYHNTQEIVAALKDIANSIRVIDFRFKGEGYDIADFLEENPQSDFWLLYDRAETLYQNVQIQKITLTKNILLTPMPTPEIILPSVLNLPKGVLGVIAGKGGEGKSLLALYVSLMAIKNYGYTVSYITLEDSPNIVIYRVQDLINTHFFDIETFSDKLQIIRTSNMTVVNEGRLTRSGKFFFKTIEDLEDQLIFVDPAGLIFGDENSNQNVEIIMSRLQSIAEGNNNNIILIHHTRKSSDDLYNSIRGASAITANARWVGIVNRSDTTLYLNIIKNNYYPINLMPIKFNIIKEDMYETSGTAESFN